MSRIALPAALLAALMSTTSQVRIAQAGDMPLDALPFGLSAPVHKKKPAPVYKEGELVPLQMPGDRPAAHSAATGEPKVPHVAHRAAGPDVAAYAPPEQPTTAHGGMLATQSGAPVAAAVQKVQASSPPAQTAAQPGPEPLSSAVSGAAPTAVPLAAPTYMQPGQLPPATPSQGQPQGLPVPPPVRGRPLKASLTTPTDEVFATAASPAPQLPQAGGSAHAIPAGATTQPSLPARNTVLPVNNGLTIEAGSGRVIELAATTSSVFAADPKVVEVRPASATTLFVFGVAPGRTTVAALDSNGHAVAQYEVTVIPNAFAAGAGSGGITHALPGGKVRLDTLGDGVSVNGSVANPGEAEHAMAIARSYLSKDQGATNRMAVSGPVQVNLKVRVAEMSRQVTRDLGVSWSAMADIGKYATFSGATANALSAVSGLSSFAGNTKKGGVDAVLDALAQDNLVHSLAEPNLTAMSGETASFLVGGEFPIPVAQQNNQTTIDFKQYGVSLAFVPTVLNDGHISLKVRPEVSQLTTTGAVTLSSGNSSFQIPALTVRRAETTVELGSGQSFAIAGLLQDATTISDSALPFLGEVPILGALFRSDAFQRNETELVIIVTPFIVRPTSNPSAIVAPTDNVPIPNDYERLLLLRQVGRKPTQAANGNGFVVQ